MSAPSDHIAELIQKHLDGQMAPAELAELGEALRADPELAAEIFRSARLQLVLPPVLEASQAASAAADRAAVEGERLNVGGLESPVAPAPSTANFQPLIVPMPQPPPPKLPPSAARRSSLRARLSWTVVAAAAAVILVVSGLHVLGILPTRYTTIMIINLGNADRTQRLYDGTVVTAAPGAKAEARGADDARKVRQLIKLESGEIEVNAPKARKGEVACRVETPEGLWVETVGTVFKVTRAWEDEKGERSVDRSKLTGAAIAALLLVAVSEGEVRTGNAAAEEARVAAGGDAVVKAADVPKAGEKIAWGWAANGLKAGLSAKQTKFEVGKQVDLDVHLGNAGPVALKAPGAGLWANWDLAFAPEGGGAPILAKCDAEMDLSYWSKEVNLAVAQTQKALALTAAPPGGGGPAGLTLPRLPAGKYTVTASFDTQLVSKHEPHQFAAGEWQGKVTTGPVEIEIAEPGKAEEKVSWGQAVGGLQAGIVLDKTRLKVGEPLTIGLHLRNAGQERLLLYDAVHPSTWNVRFTSAAGKGNVEPTRNWRDSRMAPLPERLEKGQALTWRMGCNGGESDAYGYELHMTPGKYVATATYRPGMQSDCWQGEVTSGPVEIEVGAPGKAGDAAQWGQAANGLQGLIEVEKSTVAPGEDIRLTFWLRADEKQKESLFVWDNKYSSGYRNDSYLVKTPDGKEIQLRLPVQGAWDKNAPRPVELRPGVPVRLEGWTGPLKSLKALGLDTKTPGKYVITGVYEEAAAGRMWGGKLTTLSIEVKVEAPKPEEKVSWGQVVGGLQAGLSAKRVKFPAGDGAELHAHVKNAGDLPLRLMGGVQHAWNWKVLFVGRGGETAYRASIHPPPKPMPPAPDVDLRAGESMQIALECRHWCPEGEREAGDASNILKTLPPGKYTVTASYEHADHPQRELCPHWHGKVTSGPVGIEIAEAGGAKAPKVDRSRAREIAVQRFTKRWPTWKTHHREEDYGDVLRKATLEKETSRDVWKIELWADDGEQAWVGKYVIDAQTGEIVDERHERTD